MNIQQIITVALPLIAALVSYAIQRGHWSDRANTIIASTAVVFAAGITAFLQGQLTGNIITDIMMIATASVALQGTAFAPLQQWLKDNFVAQSRNAT